jgi:tRNA 2-thiouridine synthesizing protein A
MFGAAANLVRSCPCGPFQVRVMTQAHNVTADATLDATGLLCPLPVLKARRALKPLAPGAILEILATDPGATKDFEHFCQTTGCELLEASEEPGGVLRFRLKKPG